MAYLGTIRGRATITVGDNDIGEVGYSISVFRPRQLTEARGHITGPGSILMAAMQARGATLRLEGGETVDVIVTNYRMPSDRAEIIVSGPVPGF